MLQSCTSHERPTGHPGSFGGGDLRKRLKRKRGKVRLADVQPKLDSEGLHHLILRSAKRPARTIPEIVRRREEYFQGAWPVSGHQSPGAESIILYCLYRPHRRQASSHRDSAWLEANAVGVGAGLPAIGPAASPQIHQVAGRISRISPSRLYPRRGASAWARAFSPSRSSVCSRSAGTSRITLPSFTGSSQ